MAMVKEMKYKMFQLSTIIKVLIKLSDDNVLEPMWNTIERINNKTLLSSKEMDKTLREIEKDKKESSVDRTNKNNGTVRKVKEKQKVVEAMEEEIDTT